MIDVITYIPDLSVFRTEAEDNAKNKVHGFSFSDEGINYNVNKIPVYYNPDGVRSLCLVRLITEEDVKVFDSLSSCERIGVCENNAYSFDQGGEGIYNDTYDKSLDDPSMIGVFAS